MTRENALLGLHNSVLYKTKAASGQRLSIQSHLKTGAACCLPLVQEEDTSEVLQGSPDMTHNMACRGVSASPVIPALCSGDKQKGTEKLVMEV